MVRGIILAAGRGSRLKALTEDRPKCLVEVAGRPLLHWQLDAMRGAGIDRIMVVCGYLKEMIRGDFDVCENPRWNETHMVASLWCAKEWLDAGPCIVSYADILYDRYAIARLTTVSAPLAILYDTQWEKLWRRRFDDPMADAESFKIDANGHVTEIGRRNAKQEEVQGQYMGLLKFTPESTAWVERVLGEEEVLIDRLDMTSLLARLIHGGRPVQGVPWDGAWCEVDSERDLEVANQIWEHSRQE